MSSRIIRLSSPNSASARARASSVLPTPVGPRNRKLPAGPGRVAQPGPRPADRLGYRLDRLVLADDPVVQVLLQAQQPVFLLLGELAHRDAGGPRHHLGDVVRGDLGHRGGVAAAQIPELLPDLADLGKRSSMRSTRASLAARSRGAGKYRMTSGSALIAANGSRSSSRQRRMTRRCVLTNIEPAPHHRSRGSGARIRQASVTSSSSRPVSTSASRSITSGRPS